MAEVDPGSAVAVPGVEATKLLPDGWLETPEVLALQGAPSIEEIRALIERGNPGDPLVRNAYVGTLLECLPRIRRIALGEYSASVKEQTAAAKLLQQVVQTLGDGAGGKGSAAVPTGGLGAKGRRLTFSVVMESAGEASARDMLTEVAGMIQAPPP